MSYAQQVQNAWYAGLAFAVAAVVFFVLTHRSEDHGPMLWQVWRDRYLMSRGAAIVPQSSAKETEQRPYAMGQAGNGPEQAAGSMFLSVVRYLEQCDDDTRLDILAQMCDANGAWLYAESRVARFIGGRVEDRIAQVREARGIEAEQPPGRLLRVKDDQGERLIPMEG